MRVRKLEPLSFEESESRALLMKQWTRYKLQQHANEMNTIQTAMLSQQVALQELRNESEELYQQAILVSQERRKLSLFSIILTHDPLHDGVALYNLLCTLAELSPSIKILWQSLYIVQPHLHGISFQGIDSKRFYHKFILSIINCMS